MGDPNQRKSMIDFTPRRPEQVTLTVGKDRLGWVIDAKSLEKSTHFSDLLEASDTYKLELPEEDPLLLRVYLHFLVTDELPDLLTVGDERRFTTLAKLCVYGANQCDKNFAHAVIIETRRLVVAVKVNPSAEGVQVIYDGTSSPSPVRELLIDLFYHHGWPYWVTWVKDDIKNYPAEFLQDMLLKRITENEIKELHTGSEPRTDFEKGRASASDLTITDDVLAAMRLSEAQIKVLLNTNDMFKAIIGKNAKSVVDQQLGPLKEQIATKDGEIVRLTAEIEAAESHITATMSSEVEGLRKELEERFEQKTQKRDAGLRKQLNDGRAAQREQATKELQRKFDAEFQRLRDDHIYAFEKVKRERDQALDQLEAAQSAKDVAVKTAIDQANRQADMKQRVITCQKDMAQSKWNAVVKLATDTPYMHVKQAVETAGNTWKTKPTEPRAHAQAAVHSSTAYNPSTTNTQWQDRFDGSFNKDAKKRKRNN